MQLYLDVKIFTIVCLFYATNIYPGILATVPEFRLTTNATIPAVALGIYWIRSSDVQSIISTALELGYRHFDIPFRFEEAVGLALTRWLLNGGKREELFITAKLPVFANRASDVEKFINQSLERLGVEYLDLYSIQLPFSFLPNNASSGSARNPDGTYELDLDSDLLAVWKEMEFQVSAGKVKSLGVGNFNQSQISMILDAAVVKPSNLEVELHLDFQQKELREFCQNHNITITGYAPLGSPHARARFHPNQTLGEFPDLLQDVQIRAIGEKYGKTGAQVILKYLVQLGVIVVVKSGNVNILKEDLNIFDFDLTENEMKVMAAYDRGEAARIFDFKFFKGVEKHPQYPFGNQV